MYDMNTLLRDGLDKIKSRVIKTIDSIRREKKTRDELREAVRGHAFRIGVEEWQVWYMLSHRPEHRDLVRDALYEALQQSKARSGREIQSNLVGRLRAFERYLFGPTSKKPTSRWDYCNERKAVR